MYLVSFYCKPLELGFGETLVEVFLNPSPREVVSVLKFAGCGRFGIIIDSNVLFWRGDVFHGTVLRKLWELGYSELKEWDERLYFEKGSTNIISTSLRKTLDEIETKDIKRALFLMKSAYPRALQIVPGESDLVLYKY